MYFEEIINNKSFKPKEKTEALSRWLLENPGQLDELLRYAGTAKDPVKATCIEAIEYATKESPDVSALSCLQFVTQTLTEKAPRVKWESAKVIGNIAHLYPGHLGEATRNLLTNTEHKGTVVRWSAAFALTQIVKVDPVKNEDLILALEAVCGREEKNSIRKIYADALKRI